MRRLVLALAILLVTATPATADFPGVNGQIAYDRAGQIWLTNQDGSAQHEIATGGQPAWSADGKRIAYVANPTGSTTGELMVMNADGSNQRPIDTDLGPNVTTPSWSPDGTQVVVSAFGDLYAVPVAGGRSRLVASNGTNPTWSPDGSLIAFTRGTTTIMLVHPDGSDLHALVPSGTGNTANPQISWSPDGKRIAFTGVSDGGIDAVGVDGTGLEQIVPHGYFGRSVPAWSPDGTRIAFLDNGDLCTAAIGGAEVARLTWTPITIEPPGRPAWQPLPPGSVAAGVAGSSVGPLPGYPRGTPWYPSCDRPDDLVTVSASGPSFAYLGSLVKYTVTFRNGGNAPILVTAANVVSGGAPRAAAPGQGRCYPFSRHSGGWENECDLGGLLAGDVVAVRLPVVPGRAGTLEVTGYKGASAGQQQRTSTTRTDVVRCTIRGTQGADRIRGTRHPDVICGFGGNDRIDVRGGGEDTVFCGPGRDTVLADATDRIAPDCEHVRR